MREFSSTGEPRPGASVRDSEPEVAPPSPLTTSGRALILEGSPFFRDSSPLERERFSAETVILTRLFTASRHLRYVRGILEGLRWFSYGSLLASLALVLLWNWDRLPGAWQWLAASGRPRELLWLPLLLALGGFASRWLVLPPPRETAYRVDRLRCGQEQLLTAVDWILSEKPRTAVSQRLLARAAFELEDEQKLRSDLRQLEKVPPKTYLSLFSLAIPVALLLLLPAHVGLPDTAAVWLGTQQVDRLTEALAEELERPSELLTNKEKLAQTLKNLERAGDPSQHPDTQPSLREIQRVVDELKQLAKAQESARHLLETLAQRAQQGQSLSEADRQALEKLQKMMGSQEQRQTLEQAAQEWADGKTEAAAERLEELQRQAGEASQELKEMASDGETAAEKMPQEEQGEQFDESQGDQYQEQGTRAGQGSQAGQGSPQTGNEGAPVPGDFGYGSTEQEELGPNATGQQRQRQSERTSDRSEEFQNLHPPVRVEMERSQTKVRGELTEDGPRHRINHEGLGQATHPATLQGGGTVLEYREQAENALLREEIPADYREQVRLYFEALDQ